MSWKKCILACLLAAAFSAHAAPTDLDPGFGPVSLLGNPIDPAYGVWDIEIASHDRIYLAGNFISVNGLSNRGVARLLPDGSLDPAFNPPPFELGPDCSIALQPDGKLLINRRSDIGITGRLITRLNEDGSIDPTFLPPGGANHILVSPDQKVYIAERFKDMLPREQYFFARLLPDGNFDQTYSPPVFGYPHMTESGLVEMALQPDGKLILAGAFRTTNHSHLARFNQDGSEDLAFSGQASAPLYCKALLLQPDGKILHGGLESVTIKGRSDIYARVRRYNSDRTLDERFNAPIEIPGSVFRLALQPDGKILAGGVFHTPDNSWSQHVLRLHPNGQLDTSFDFYGSFKPKRDSGIIRDIIVQPDGKILLAGRFTYHAEGRDTRFDLIRLVNQPAFLTESTALPTGEIQFLWQLANTNLTYHLQASPDLKTWSTIATPSRGSRNLIHTTSPTDSPTQFLRLLAQ